MVRTICPSLPMRMKALGTNGAADAPIEGPVLNPINRPPPNATPVLRNWRREIISGPFLAVRRVLDSRADSHIGAAPTDVPRHGGVDIAIGRVGLGREQRRRGHDLAGRSEEHTSELQSQSNLVCRLLLEKKKKLLLYISELNTIKLHSQLNTRYNVLRAEIRNIKAPSPQPINRSHSRCA